MYFFYYVPIGLNTALRRFPAMTWSYAAICCTVFAWVRFFPYALPLDFYNLIYVPTTGHWLTAVAAAFLHFGWLHLIGNLLYLMFFGRYVEDRLGAVQFTILYLTSAGIGNYLQGLFNSRVLDDPYLGIIGASGAVSGLLGAFCVRFVTSRMRIAYWVFLPLQAYTRAGRAELPALFAVALWFLMQAARGLIQLEGADIHVAYVTHVGGFIWGAGLAVLFGHYRAGRVESLLVHADAYMRKGEPYAAQGCYIRYLTHYPAEAPVYAALARAMAVSANEHGARKNFRKACEMLIAQGKRGDGEKLYQEALRAYEGFTLEPKRQLNLAFGLERNLKAEAAVHAYENFARRYPTHHEAGFALLRAAGLYRDSLSRPKRASDCYQRLIDEYPADRWVEFAREQLRFLRPTEA